MRDKFSTVIGFSVLTLLLTAGAAQSLAGSNTVFGDDIVDGTISHADVKANSLGGSRLLDNAVTGGKLLDNTVKGSDVDENTLVLVCRAETNATPTTLEGDFCYSAEKPAANFQNAISACNELGMHLPSLSEATQLVVSADGTDTLWVDNAFQDDGINKAVTTLGGTSYSYQLITNQVAYRCVTTVGSRP